MGSSGIVTGIEKNSGLVTANSYLSGLIFGTPVPTESFNCSSLTPAYKDISIFTKDLKDFPLNNLPSGGPCTSTIRIGPSEMCYSAIKIYGPFPAGPLDIIWKKKNGATFYTAHYDVPARLDGNSWFYVWSFVGHFDWEINEPGDYQVIYKTSGGEEQMIEFKVINTAAPATVKAVPSIVSSTGYVIDSNTIGLMCLYENKASLGYMPGVVKFQGSSHTGTLCNQDLDPASIDVFCANTTAYNLKGLAMPLVRGKGVFSIGCIESFGCAGGDVCGTYPLFQDACTTWGTRVSFETSIPIRARNTSFPLAPTGLKVTPGSGLLTIDWNMVNDPTGGEVFAYHIIVYDGSTVVIDGYTEAGLRTVNIGGLTNGKVHSIHVTAISHNGTESLSSAIGEGTPGVASSSPTVYNITTTPETPLAGASVTIKAQIANTGYDGKVRAVFKAGTTQISDQNSTLATFPGGGLWEPTFAYTMPTTATTFTVEAYGWNGTAWVLTDTKSISRTPGTVSCTTTTLTPYAASIEAGEKVTFTAEVTPATTPFAVQFKDRADNVLGACTTGAGGTCTFIWDSAGKPAGTYYVKAVSGSCYSTESVIILSPPISQFTVTIYVMDSAGIAINGATVAVGTQTKATDVYGIATFLVDQGSIEVSISKTGYTSMPPVTELVFNNKSFNYVLSAATATTGSIQFVSINTGAQVSVDNVVKGTIPSAGSLTVSNLPVGTHTYKVTLAGYNSSTGSVTVTGGVTAVVSFVLTVLSPTTGSLYIYSSPSAAIFLGGVAITAHTPTTIPAIAPGVYAIKLTAAGYQDWTGTTTIEAGKTNNVSATLKVLTTTGTLEIDSVPQGARVYIDGVDEHKITKASIQSMAAGSHTYKLELSGYGTVQGEFKITAGTTTIVSETLTEVPAGTKTATASSPASTTTVIVVTLVGLTALAILLAKKKGMER